jgi:hypothetical protein
MQKILNEAVKIQYCAFCVRADGRKSVRKSKTSCGSVPTAQLNAKSLSARKRFCARDICAKCQSQTMIKGWSRITAVRDFKVWVGVCVRLACLCANPNSFAFDCASAGSVDAPHLLLIAFKTASHLKNARSQTKSIQGSTKILRGPVFSESQFQWEAALSFAEEVSKKVVTQNRKRDEGVWGQAQKSVYTWLVCAFSARRHRFQEKQKLTYSSVLQARQLAQSPIFHISHKR